MKRIHPLRSLCVCLLVLLGAVNIFAQTSGSITGQITDESAGAIPAANVTVLKAGAIVKAVQTDEQGNYSSGPLSPGTYTVRITHFGFAPMESKAVVAAGQKATFSSQLRLQTSTQQVTVQAEAVGTVSVDASQNASALVLKQAEIDALPDDPDDLASDLQALAGPAAGPNGGQVFIDGFTGGRLPPKESIREIRINQNPFSSEYDRLGFGRIEILTKPGSDKFHGQAFFNDSDGVFNARNPFLSQPADFSSRQFGGNVSGPLGKKASFFFDFERRNIDDSAVVTATILDPNFNPLQFNQAVPTPQRRTELSPRLDYAINSSNTLVVKYSWEKNTVANSGVGLYSLATRGSNSDGGENSIQATETAVLSPTAINETRFRFLRSNTDLTALDTATGINVSAAFNGGGSGTVKSAVVDDEYEIQNYTSITHGTQAIKFGGRIRTDSTNNLSQPNPAGSFTFAGGIADVLNSDGTPKTDGNGVVLTTVLSPIQQYQQTLMLINNLKFTAPQLQALGLGPSQYSVSGGNPTVKLTQMDAGLFFQDDWRIKPSLSLNFGLRYEVQNQISDWRDIAPRFGFAWSPDAKANKPGKTVIRGGSGIFYDRVDEGLSLAGIRFNGINQQRYVLANTSGLPLDIYNAPPVSQLTALAQTIQQLDPNIRAPYTIQSAIGVERQLPRNTTLSVTYTNSRGVHLLRTRNINAPNPALGLDAATGTYIRPYGDAAGNIYNYESDGIFNQNQLLVNVNTRFSKRVSLFGFYMLNHAKGNSDGVGTFPANQYDFSTEYGRAAFDIRHRAFIGGSVTAPWSVRLSPFITMRSGSPFNITSGQDLNGDSVFSDRPALSTLPCGSADVYCTTLGEFTTRPAAGQAIIPRNYGNGPNSFSINMRLSKTFGFGESKGGSAAGGDQGGPRFGGIGMGGGGPRGGGGGRGGPGGMFGGESTPHRYNLTFTAQARNLLNNVSYANPVSVLTAPNFGEFNALGQNGPGGSTVNNRRLEFGLRFAF